MKIKAAAGVLMTACLLSACDSRTGTGDTRDPANPQAALTGKRAGAEEAAAAQRQLDAIRPSLKDADSVLRSLPDAERRATVKQLKCLAAQAVERGMQPRPRTVEVVAEARALAAKSVDGSCAQPGNAGVMLPASSKSGVRPVVSGGGGDAAKAGEDKREEKP